MVADSRVATSGLCPDSPILADLLSTRGLKLSSTSTDVLEGHSRVVHYAPSLSPVQTQAVDRRMGTSGAAGSAERSQGPCFWRGLDRKPDFLQSRQRDSHRCGWCLRVTYAAAGGDKGKSTKGRLPILDASQCGAAEFSAEAYRPARLRIAPLRRASCPRSFAETLRHGTMLLCLNHSNERYVSQPPA